MKVKEYAFDIDDPESMLALEQGEYSGPENRDDEYLEALLGITEE